MNKKIYLNIYENDQRLKKYRLEEGKYNIGNKKGDSDIYVNEESLENSLEVIIKEDQKVYLKLIKKNKNVLLNDSKISSVDEKYEIKDKDQIAFKNSNIKLKFKFVEINRERSRSKDNSKKVIMKTVKEIEQPKPTSDSNSKSYIKSEVIWNSVEFGDNKRKEKFLKLMGATKKNQAKTPSELLDKTQTEKLQQTFQKIDNDLTKQFYNAIGRKPPI